MTPQKHPLRPFFPDGARLLMLGSFPPPRNRWSMEFYYPNFANDMWRIFGSAFFGDPSKFVVSGEKHFDREALIGFLKSKKIALYDAATEVVRGRGNASDKYLEIESKLDVSETLALLPDCVAVAATGGKSAESIAESLGVEAPPTGGFVSVDVPVSGGDAARVRAVKFFRMPSSSRAYPLSLEKKTLCYASMFRNLGML